eukprot:TRINITY_DN8522_c1_g1_i1.p1 TRINITY_DN8522_c1_g1~~TRINITY_DN8522_c1_g1_i1.p1  ORF type:complete len:243 (-),score=25.39 TRINITY_DN8522_c1_g1_i1:168-803(-)
MSHSLSPRRSRSSSESKTRRRKVSPNSRSRSRSPSRSRSHRRSSRSRSPRNRRHRSRSLTKRPSQNSTPPCKVLGVFGLHPRTKESDLKSEFTRYGNLNEINLITDHRTGQSKCFAFVYFDDVDDARKAKENMNGMNLHGRNIRIDFSFTKKAHSPTPGQYMGKSSRSSRHRERYHPYDYRRSPPREHSRHRDRDGRRRSRDRYDRHDRRH